MINANTIPMFKTPEIVDDFDSAHDIVLKCGDTLQFLQSLPQGFAKLIVTSPPYNLGKEYEHRTAIESGVHPVFWTMS
jgi:adenine-specific DNA-methyltransferase